MDHAFNGNSLHPCSTWKSTESHDKAPFSRIFGAPKPPKSSSEPLVWHSKYLPDIIPFPLCLYLCSPICFCYSCLLEGSLLSLETQKVWALDVYRLGSNPRSPLLSWATSDTLFDPGYLSVLSCRRGVIVKPHWTVYAASFIICKALGQSRMQSKHSLNVYYYNFCMSKSHSFCFLFKILFIKL